MLKSFLIAGTAAAVCLSAPAAWSASSGTPQARTPAVMKATPSAKDAAAPKPAQTVPTAEPFEGSVLAEGLDSPWDMIWGPDGHIWVTERRGARVTSVDPATGAKKVLVDVPDVFVGPQHEGVLGLALDPRPGKDADRNHVYLSHTYMDGAPGPGHEHARSVRFDYDAATGTLSNPKAILSGLPAGDDHNGGRLRFGPDGTLYYSIGEQGHNQGANACKPNYAQRLPTADELDKADFTAYAGKILRLNTDGSVPDDNPTLNGVRSHVYTYGHRNPQGLVWVGDTLFECEHGPSTDDEINLIEAGGNYGWPNVAGFQDDLSYAYYNWSEAENCADLPYDANHAPSGVPMTKESRWPTPDNFRPPLRTFYTVPDGYNFDDTLCGDLPYLCWPTLAPSSLAWYPDDGPIPGWGNSLLVTSLKNGALYRLPLNPDGKTVQGDQWKYFHTPNRYRAALVSPDGRDIYVATDVSGNVMDENGRPVNAMRNPGSILKFHYTPNQ